MNNQNDIIDQLIIRPIKKVKEKKTIPANQIFEGIKTKKKYYYLNLMLKN